MANIIQYKPGQSPTGAIQQQRASLEDPVGRALVGFGGAVSDAADAIQKRQEQRELTKLNADMASLQAERAIALSEAMKSADPHDDKFVEKFQTETRDRIAKLGEGVETRAAKDYLTKAGAHLDASVLQSSFYAQAELSAKAAVADWTTANNQRTSALTTDPSQFEATIAQINLGLDAQVAAGTLSRELAIKLKAENEKDAAIAAASGWSALNPQYAKKMIEGGAFDKYVDGPQKASLIGHAEQAIRAQEADANRAITLANRQREQIDGQAQTEWMGKIAEGSYTFRDLTLDTRLKPESMRALASAARADLGRKGDTKSQAYYQDLQDILDNRTNDPNVILHRVAGDTYSLSDAQALIKVMQGKGTPEGNAEAALMKTMTQTAYQLLAKPDKTTGLVDPYGLQQFLTWQADFLQKFNAAKETGRSGLSLLDPKSPEYLGSTISNYEPSAAQIIQNMVSEAQQAAASLAAQKTGQAPVPQTGTPPNTPTLKPTKSIDDFMNGK